MTTPWELGEPLTYKALGRDSVPLSRALVWPHDMDDRNAEFFVELAEARGAVKIGAVNPHPHMWAYIRHHRTRL